ncbi:signal peptidase I SipW [Brevibacillus composti]|nr:signal peptidase I [Brevibacillus composti]
MAAVLKWLSRITTAILVLILLSLLAFALSAKWTGGSPTIMGKELLTVLSGSMEPGIQTGSVIAVTPKPDPQSLQVGDVITFKSADNASVLITHRILEVKTIDSELHFITKGDNNDAPDSSPVPASHVVGVYADLTVPYLGFILNFLKSKAGIALFLIVPGVYLILSQMISLWRTIAQMEKEKEASKEPIG